MVYPSVTPFRLVTKEMAPELGKFHAKQQHTTESNWSRAPIFVFGIDEKTIELDK